jgi:hypothetical protein
MQSLHEKMSGHGVVKFGDVPAFEAINTIVSYKDTPDQTLETPYHANLKD